MQRDVELSPSFKTLLGLMRARFTLASLVGTRRECEQHTRTVWYFISFALWFSSFRTTCVVTECNGRPLGTRRQMQITWFDWKRGPETVYLSARVSALLNKMALWLQLEVCAVFFFFLLLQWLNHQNTKRLLKASRRFFVHVYSWTDLHTHLHISITLIYRAYLFVFLKVCTLSSLLQCVCVRRTSTAWYGRRNWQNWQHHTAQQIHTDPDKPVCVSEVLLEKLFLVFCLLLTRSRCDELWLQHHQPAFNSHLDILKSLHRPQVALKILKALISSQDKKKKERPYSL